ncbi:MULTISPECIES: methanobactin-like peptide MovA [Photorhabdus]
MQKKTSVEIEVEVEDKEMTCGSYNK